MTDVLGTRGQEKTNRYTPSLHGAIYHVALEIVSCFAIENATSYITWYTFKRNVETH